MAKIKKFIFILIIVVLIFSIQKITEYISLKIFESKLMKVLPKNEKNFNFTKTIIGISSIFDVNPDPAWVENRIYHMADTLKQKIGAEAKPENIINIFNKYFFEIENFSFDEKFTNTRKLSYSQLIEYNSIKNALETKKTICLTLSLIYIMLGDILKLPLYGVLLPGHIYVRYREEGKSGINIETTFKGLEYYGYIGISGINIYDNNKSFYGKELNKYQVIGAYLNNLGSSLLSIGKFQQAEILLNQSFKYLPSIAEPYINLGILYEKLTKPHIALKYYLKAYEINPQNDFILTKIGIIFFKNSRLIKAREYLEKAIRINKQNTEAAYYLQKIKERRTVNNE